MFNFKYFVTQFQNNFTDIFKMKTKMLDAFPDKDYTTSLASKIKVKTMEIWLYL